MEMKDREVKKRKKKFRDGDEGQRSHGRNY